MTNFHCRLPRLGIWCLLGALALGCQKEPESSPWVRSEATNPPPKPSASTSIDAALAAPTPAPSAGDVAEIGAAPTAATGPLARLRLFVPGAVPPRRLDEPPPTARVTVGDLPPLMGEVLSFRDARAGLATLLVITSQGDMPQQLIAVDTFVRHAGPADRMALGVIDGAGFRLLRPFTADPSVLPSAARDVAASLQASPRGEPAAASTAAPVALHPGLLEAFTAFRGEEALSAVRRLVLLSDGVDTTIARRSVLERLVGSITNRAAAYEVPILAVLLGKSGGAHAALEQLVRGTGGKVTTVKSLEPTAVEAAVQEMLTAMRALVAVDVTLGVLPTPPSSPSSTSPSDEVPVVVTWDAERFERRIAVPVASPARIDHAMVVPTAVPKTLPLGLEDLGRAEADAEVAEAAGNLLRAGAIWHLLAEADPEKAAWAERAADVDSRFRSEGAWGLDEGDPPAGTDGGRAIHLGELVNGDRPITVPVSVNVELARIPIVAKERLSLDLPIDLIAKPRLPPPDPESVGPPGPQPDATPITQVVLSRCVATSVDECVESTVIDGQLPHLVVDHDGAVTQLIDLASRIAYGPSRRVEAIHIAVFSPPDAAWSYAEPGAHGTGRASRGKATGLPTPGGFEDVWDFSPRQVDVLVPLLRGLVSANPRLRATFPLDEDKHVVRAPLKDPDNHRGFLLSCNVLRTPIGCPGLPPTLDRLHATVRKFRFATAPDLAKPTNLESSLDDLALLGAREGAALRYGIVGELAVPFLLEVGDEATLAQLHGVVLALHAVARHAQPTVRARVLRGLETFEAALEQRGLSEDESSAETTESRRRVRAAIDAVFLDIGDVRDLLTRYAKNAKPEENPAAANPAMALLTAAAASLPAKAAAPIEEGTKAELASAIEKHLTSASPALRSQAAMALLLLDPEAARARIEPLLLDADPWVRFIAARAMPVEKGFEYLLPLFSAGTEGRAPALPAALLARTVGNLIESASPPTVKRATDALADAFEIAPLPELAVLKSELAKWGGVASVPKLAQKLGLLVGERKEAVLQTLRDVTGRDFGGSPEGWLLWHRQQPRERPDVAPGEK